MLDEAITLLTRIEGKLKVAPGYVEEFAELKCSAQRVFIDTLGAYGTFSPQLRKVMPKDAIWVPAALYSQTFLTPPILART